MEWMGGERPEWRLRRRRTDISSGDRSILKSLKRGEKPSLNLMEVRLNADASSTVKSENRKIVNKKMKDNAGEILVLGTERE